VKIDAGVFRITTLEPQRGALRLDVVFLGKRFLVVSVDVFERLTGSVVAGGDVGNDVQVVVAVRKTFVPRAAWSWLATLMLMWNSNSESATY
jgi:hypothetical protein